MALNDAIIASPVDLYTAPVSEAEPDVDDNHAALIGGNWELIGSQTEQLTQDEGGVTFSNTQTVNVIRGAGSTGGLKAVRSEEDVMVSIAMIDMTFEVLTIPLTGAAVTTVAPGSGTIGTKAIPIWRGPTVNEVAVLLRGPSPYLANTNMQVWLPRCYAAGDLELVFAKAEAVVVNCEFGVLMDLTQSSPNYMGKFKAQHAAAL